MVPCRPGHNRVIKELFHDPCQNSSMTPVTPPAAAAPPTATPATDPLSSLSSNFGDFLNLLMTQLQNQDPTSPMDANSFTSELVQFSSVEQQINTNSSLTQLIQLTQAADVTQSSAILGKQVTVQSSQIPLQNSSGTLNFTAPTPEKVSILVQDANLNTLQQVTVNAAQGENTWNWNGTNSSGQIVPDGAYKVTVTGGSPAVALPFTVEGTATGVTTQNGTVNLQLGTLSVPFTSVNSVGN
jgi:flagellar basal-body rod modification protein FlgD